MSLPRTAYVVLTAAALIYALPVRAEPQLSGNIGVTSDYRFRGISLSNRKPALQGGLDIDFGSGLSAGSWASTIADYGGAKVEVDLYGGLSGERRGISYTATLYAYLYPGGSGVNYAELQTSVGRDFGPVHGQILLDYAPKQDHLSRGDLYVAAQADAPVPGTPVSGSIRLGYEDYGYQSKIDWEAALNYRWSSTRLTLSYVGSDFGAEDEGGRLAKGRLLLSAAVEF